MSEASQGAAAGELVAYRNINTNTIHLYDTENADLEARPNFKRVPLTEVPAETLRESAIERANIASIAGANSARQARIKSGRDTEPDVAVEHESSGVVGTEVGGRRFGAGHSTGVLSRPGVDAVQIGPNPERHPKTGVELREQVRLDAEAPSNVGVLINQHLAGDQAAQEVPADAREAAERIAPDTQVPGVKVDDDPSAPVEMGDDGLSRPAEVSKTEAADKTSETDKVEPVEPQEQQAPAAHAEVAHAEPELDQPAPIEARPEDVEVQQAEPAAERKTRSRKPASTDGK